MTTSRQCEDAASYLQEVATPSLYLNNAFRVTGLDITATLKEAKKRIRDREQCQKLGIAWQSQRRAYFPICGTQTIDDIRIAVDRDLANPYRRIIEELFWFWPDPEEDPANNEALSYLSEGHPHKAKITWISQINSLTANIIPLHNLAVLNHLQALEGEQEIREGGCQNIACAKCQEYFRITAAQCGTTIVCPNCQVKLRTRPLAPGRPNSEALTQLWRDAHDYWSRLWISAPFWAELSLRAKNIDAILGPEIIDQIKKRLPEALLSLNVGLSIDYCSQQEYSDATRHGQLVFSSNFSEKYHISAVRHATERMIEQIHQQAILAEKNAERKPESGLQEATGLLEKTRSNLKCFEILDCGSLNLGHAAHDAVANSALNALIGYEHETHDCESLIKPTEEVLDVAKSGSLKDRISKNLAIIKNIVQRNALESNIKPVTDICERISLAVSRSLESDTSQPYTIYQRFRDEVIPRLNEIRTRFGEESEELKKASSTCAYCLRGISIALHNNSHDMAKALESIQWAVNLCKDNELLDLLKKDLKICQENAQDQQTESLVNSLRSIVQKDQGQGTLQRKTTSDIPESIKWVGAVIFSIIMIILMSKNCDESSSSSYSPSASSTGRAYTYTPPSSSNSTQTTNQPFSLGKTQTQATPKRSAYSIPGSGTTTSGLNQNSYTRSSPSSRTDISSSSRKLLRQEIETGQAKLKLMESQLETMDGQLESYKADADRYKLFEQIDNYNNLVPIHNALLAKRKQLYTEYDRLFNEVNEKVDRYNRGY